MWFAVRPVALLPTLTYGDYAAFVEYPGSVSLTFETQAMLADILAEIDALAQAPVPAGTPGPPPK